MDSEKICKVILEVMASEDACTIEDVRNNIEDLINTGVNNSDPKIRKQWSKIPKKSERLTVEEVINYCMDQMGKKYK